MTASVFDRIYQGNEWNGEESRSGPGSGRAATRRVAPELVELARDLRVESVLDVGCGDGFWMPDLPGYVGYDWSVEAIRLARQNHPDRTYVTDLPLGRYFDMVILRDAIQHLSYREGRRLLRNAWTAADKVLVASTYVDGWNVDIEPGSFYSPDLTKPPFSMPRPHRLIFDGYHYHESDEQRDPAKHLGVWVK